MSPNRGPRDAFDAEWQRLIMMGVTAESARTALTLILTFVIQYQSQQGWSACGGRPPVPEDRGCNLERLSSS